MFEKMVADFNTNRSEVMHFSAWGTTDESMGAYQPRVTKCGGLPNISFIKRKPKPLGTEFKTVVDAATRVMTCTEIQEGKPRMQEKKYAREFGVTTACTIHMAEQGTTNGSTLLGDSWFAFVKVFPLSIHKYFTHIYDARLSS
jgi:hypothetical protein